MRYLAILAAIAGLALPGAASAQPLAKFEKIRVGFQPYNQAASIGRYKLHLWTPVYVTLTAGPNGLRPDERPYLRIESPDFEDVGTIYRTPVRLEPNETATFITYTKPGPGDIKVELHVGSRTIFPFPERDQAMDFNSHVYLALGRRIGDLPAALVPKKEGKDRNQDDLQFQLGRQRAALVEDDADLLPTHWFGYDAVDLMFLSTDDRKFLERLADNSHADQLKALAQWVRRGGRLVIPISKQTQDKVSNLLRSGVWQPPIPVVPPAETGEKFPQPERLGGLETWASVQAALPAPGDKAPVVAQIEPAKFSPGDWEIDARSSAEGVPLIARVKYGMGQIVYLAVSLDDPAMAAWPGQHDFIRKLLEKYAPKTGQDIINQPGIGFGRQRESGDVTGQLYNALDNFDVRVIPFGVVAVFIVLYVVIVGPLEFVLLKYVLGRLEWTWITFPTVVLGVSIIAYFGAYALKGQDLKINKVDIVDIDLRGDLDGKGQPRSMHVQGQTFLMVLSPRIQSYTVGIEPNPPFWGDEKPAKPQSADVVSWMARPDEGRGGGGGGQGFFRKPYYYGIEPMRDAPAAETRPIGLQGVPIPVWMAKAFSASWETHAQSPPLVADLVYHQGPVGGKDLRVSGTIRSNFAVDLVDVWLFYADKCYRIEGGLPAGNRDAAAVKIALEDQHAGDVRQAWTADPNVAGQRPSSSQGMYDPGTLVKQMMFHEELGLAGVVGNHSHRRLDLSWRLYKRPGEALKDNRIRDAILVARAKFQGGPAETVSNDPAIPLPSSLWLGDLPESGRGRPSLSGNMNQDTFIRVLLPLKPAG